MSDTNILFVCQYGVRGLGPKNEVPLLLTGYVSQKFHALHRVKKDPYSSSPLSTPSVGPVNVEYTQTRYPIRKTFIILMGTGSVSMS